MSSSNIPASSPKSSNSSSHNNIDQGKIFVGGLSWQTTEESLRFHFERYGAVLSVELMKDRNTGKPRGFGFVCFADPATVDLVMQEEHEICHKIVDVKRAQARGVAPPSIHEHRQQQQLQQQQQPVEHATKAAEQQPTPEQLNSKVFVGGIPPSVDRDELRQYMEVFGPVVDCIVMLDQVTMRSRGFGFVTFSSAEGAERAIAAQPIEIQGRMVEVKLATPRGGGDQRPVNKHYTDKPVNHHHHFPSKFLGLRAGQSSSSSSGEFSGFAVAYGRSGWKAGYGSRAFGKAGWNVQGWDEGEAPDRSGFSFDLLTEGGPPPSKRARH